jgi:tetratricopeptide (TPR) repeat protein
MDIEAFLEAVGHKRYGGSGMFSKEDEVTLLEIVQQNPCRIDAQLLLIECAHYNYPRFFPQFWTAYYKEAVDKGLGCWKPEELAEIYLLGCNLYYYDQNNKPSEIEAVVKAFEIAPNYWRAIANYLGYLYDELPVDERLELIKCITKENPTHPNAYYRQARFFEEYAVESGEGQYRDAAIAAYQKSLDLGMGTLPYMMIPRKVMEEKIKQLREMSDGL